MENWQTWQFIDIVSFLLLVALAIGSVLALQYFLDDDAGDEDGDGHV